METRLILLATHFTMLYNTYRQPWQKGTAPKDSPRYAKGGASWRDTGRRARTPHGLTACSNI